MLSEIGSNFWEYSLEENIRSKDFFWMESQYNIMYFKSGRNAIKALCRNIDTCEKSVLLPIYTCETCIQPFIDEGWEISYYCLNTNLTINEKSFKKIYEIKKPKVIFVHSYFGFDTIEDESLLYNCKNNGTVIVEDMTQSLFSAHHLECADYYVTSFRKFFAIPEGGALISKNTLEMVEVRCADKTIENIALEAFDLKNEYIKCNTNQNKEIFRNKYAELDLLICQNDEIQEMGQLSKDILFSCNRKKIEEKRRKNYYILKDAIKQFDYLNIVIDKKIDDVTPLYFPVYVDRREEIQLYLCNNDVYCPIIWPKPSQLIISDKITEYMYSHMLCFPIDQRYGEDEMKKIISLLKYYKASGFVYIK